MTMNKELHLRSDVAWLYVSRKSAGRDLLDGKIVWRVKKIEPLLVTVRISRTIILEETVDLKEFKGRTKKK